MNDQERITDLILTEKKMSATMTPSPRSVSTCSFETNFSSCSTRPPDPDQALPDRAAEGLVSGGAGPGQPDRHCLYPFQQPAPPVKPIHGARPFTGLALFKVETG